MCQNLPGGLQRVCDGPVQGHHVVEKQTLKRRGLTAELWNLDNLLGVCERAHRRHTARVEKIPRSLLSPAHERFAVEHGLVDVLERAYSTLT